MGGASFRGSAPSTFEVDSFNARGYVAGVLPGWTPHRFRFEPFREVEIYVCGSDGSNPVQLTSMRAPDTGTPAWSPDGKQIAFDSRLEGHSDIFVINAEGGSPHRLTTEPYDNELPSWSRDSHWIYFTSERSADNQIWKVQPKEAPPFRSRREVAGVDSTDPMANLSTTIAIRQSGKAL